MVEKISAFTLVEMMVSLIIGVVLTFVILTLGHLNQNSYEGIRKESMVYDDIFCGFELIKNSLRKAQDPVTIANWTNPPWKSQVLVVGDTAFGLYQSNSTVDFVYLKNKNNTTQRDVILAGASPINLTFSQNATLFTTRIQGKKYSKPFNLTDSVSRRN